MAINYTILERTNNLSESKSKHYFLKLVQKDTVDLDRLCEEIGNGSSLSAVEVYGVLIALQDKIMQHLEKGNTIDLQLLGKFSVAAKVKAQENKDDVSVKDIQKFHINYMPSSKIKQWLKHKAKLKK